MLIDNQPTYKILKKSVIYFCLFSNPFGEGSFRQNNDTQKLNEPSQRNSEVVISTNSALSKIFERSKRLA